MTVALRDHGARGDGISDDAEALHAALEACRVLAASGTIPTLEIGPGTYRITHANSCFYTLAAAAWGTVAPPYADQSPNVRGLVIRGNGAILLCDGPADSCLLATAGGMFRLDIDNLTLRAFDPDRPQGGMVLRNVAHSTWTAVRFEDFELGTGLCLCEQSERNTFTNLSFHACQRGLVLGENLSTTWEAGSTANENRFIGLNFIECGRRCSDSDCLTTGFLEVNSSALPVFVGGSWKLNKNPAILRLCYGGSVQGVYFEGNGYTYHAGQAAVPNAQPGMRNHLIVDAYSVRTTGHWSAAPARNVSFSGCYFGPYSGITLRATAAHRVAGIVFDNCVLCLDGHGFMYVDGEQAHVLGTTVRGAVFDNDMDPTRLGCHREQHAINPVTGAFAASSAPGLAIRYTDDGTVSGDGSGLTNVAAETAKVAAYARVAGSADTAALATNAQNAHQAVNATNATNAQMSAFAARAATADTAGHAGTADAATRADTANHAKTTEASSNAWMLQGAPVTVVGRKDNGMALKSLLQGLDSVRVIKDATR